jgi:hypothetical protein
MAIKTGRYGQVRWDELGVTAVPLLSLNAWTGDFKTEFEDVSCFGDETRAYLPGLKAAEGTLAGFYNSSNVELFEAADQTAPGLLELVPNYTDAGYMWSGSAYLDAAIDCSLQAPKISGNWKAAGTPLPFRMKAMVVATGATAGIPGTWTPAGSAPRANLAAMTGCTATPATAWTVGQYMLMADGQKCHWNATTWVTGPKP